MSRVVPSWGSGGQLSGSWLGISDYVLDSKGNVVNIPQPGAGFYEVAGVLVAFLGVFPLAS